MAYKFKIGDTVEVVPGALDNPGYFNVGHRGKVTDYISGVSFPYRVIRNNGNVDVFSAQELKLIRKGTENGFDK